MKKYGRMTGTLLGFGAAAVLVSRAFAGPNAGEGKNIVETAITAGQFGTLVKAVQVAGLADTLSGSGPFTVFAPTDEAFAKLPVGVLDSLLKNPEALKGVLLFHVVSGKVMAADVAKMTSAKTVLGQALTINASKGVKVNGATVVKTDVTASNGVIHVIDAVMLPRRDIIEAARSAGSFKTLLAAIDAAGLTETLRGDGPFTVFAPTDEAFAKLPAGALEALLKDKAKLKSVLTYHVVSGLVLAADVAKLNEARTLQGQSLKIDTTSGVKVDGAQVVKTDIRAENGAIHVIDTVVMPK